ncbi:MAG: nitroreductase family protein [Pikeienuella sp.]
MTKAPAISAALAARFGPETAEPVPDHALDGVLEAWRQQAIGALLDRRACRHFRAETVDEPLLRLVIAAGLSAPSKSDLQQADVIWVRDRQLRAQLTAGCGSWAEALPAEAELLVVVGDGRRLRRLFGPDWPNDHFDALFNATGDAAILLGQLVNAATLAGLGSCPISVMRNSAEVVAAALALPERVFPFAGLAIGWPEAPRAAISPRLGLEATLHIDRFDAAGQEAAIARYDQRRATEAPYPVERDPERFGPVSLYGWSEDKRRQYSLPQRTRWGAFLRACGFRFD